MKSEFDKIMVICFYALLALGIILMSILGVMTISRFPWGFAIVGFGLVVLYLINIFPIKSLEIINSTIIIRYIFLRKTYEYDISQTVSCKERSSMRNRTWCNFTICFDDGKKFKLRNYYSNYRQMTEYFKNKTAYTLKKDFKNG